jgi:hypothetical protein
MGKKRRTRLVFARCPGKSRHQFAAVRETKKPGIAFLLKKRYVPFWGAVYLIEGIP